MSVKPLEGVQLVLVTIALSLAVFMQVLDSTIANVALPSISGDLGAATSQGTWVITSFAVANAISIPLTGFLAKRIGEVKLFIWSTTFFVFASWLCGIAHSLEALIFYRVFQGFVAGPMIPLSQSLLMSCYPKEKQPMAMGLWSMVIVVAPIFGPILGGFISNHWHWGWIFFINVPIGIISLSIAWKSLKNRESKITNVSVDKIGLALLVLAVACLQLMLDKGKELDWFNSNEIIALLIISVVAFSYLIVWELGCGEPIIDLSLFKNRNFAVGCITLSLAFMVYMGTVVLLPMLLQVHYGYTAVWAGLAASPIGFFPILLAPIIGMYGRKLDMRVLITLSFLIYAVCFFWRSKFNLEMSFWDVVWPQFWQGLGAAMFFMPLTLITLSEIKSEQMAAASSLSNFIRVLAGGVGTSFFISLWEEREAFHHSRLTENIHHFNWISNEWFNQLSSMGLSNDIAAGSYINRMITQQSYIMGSNEIYYLSGIAFIGLTLLIWLSRRIRD